MPHIRQKPKYVSSIIKCPCKCDCDQTLDVAITAFKEERKMDRYQSINMVKSKAKPKSKGKGKN